MLPIHGTWSSFAFNTESWPSFWLFVGRATWRLQCCQRSVRLLRGCQMIHFCLITLSLVMISKSDTFFVVWQDPFLIHSKRNTFVKATFFAARLPLAWYLAVPTWKIYRFRGTITNFYGHLNTLFSFGFFLSLTSLLTSLGLNRQYTQSSVRTLYST